MQPRVAGQLVGRDSWRADIPVLPQFTGPPSQYCGGRTETFAPPLVIEQLALELKRGLLGREQDQRRSLRRRLQRRANLAQAAISFAAAGGAEEKRYLHECYFAANRSGRKEIYFFLFRPGTAFVRPTVI